MLTIVAYLDLIEIDTRVCDLCNARVTDQEHVVTNSFVLTDWGLICIECWDDRLTHHNEWRVERIYIKAMKIDDEWVRRPFVFMGFGEGLG